MDGAARLRDRLVVVALESVRARIWLLNGDDADPVATFEPPSLGARHRRAVLESRATDEGDSMVPFFVELAGVLEPASHVLLAGHGSGKSDVVRRFLEHLSVHSPSLASRTVVIADLDPSAVTDAELLARARTAWAKA